MRMSSFTQLCVYQVIKWAYEKGCKWHASVCAQAAMHEHLHIIKWAREHGCEWDENTCSSAAIGNQLEVLQYGNAYQARMKIYDAGTRTHARVHMDTHI